MTAVLHYPLSNSTAEDLSPELVLAGDEGAHRLDLIWCNAQSPIAPPVDLASSLSVDLEKCFVILPALANRGYMFPSYPAGGDYLLTVR